MINVARLHLYWFQFVVALVFWSTLVSRTSLAATFRVTQIKVVYQPKLFIVAQSKDAITAYQKGEQLYSVGKFQDAVEELDRATQLSSNYAAAWLLRGKALFHLEQLDLAMFSLNNAVRYDPQNSFAWKVRGDILIFLGQSNEERDKAREQYELAIESYERALEFMPQSSRGDRAEALFGCSTASFALGNLLTDMRVVSIRQKNEEMASHYRELANQKYEQAVTFYDEVIKLAKLDNDINQMVNAWWQRGETLRRLKRLPEALASLNQAIQHMPDFSEGWYRRGRVLGEDEKWEAAIASYDKAISLDPSYAEAWYNRGLELISLKHYEKAIDSFEKAIGGNIRNQWRLETDLSAADFYYGKAKALYLLKNYSGAIDFYNQAIKVKGNNFATAWTDRGTALLELRRYKDALDSFKQALEVLKSGNADKDFDAATAWYGQGYAYYYMNHYQESVDSFDQAIQLNSALKKAIKARQQAQERLKLGTSY